MEDCGVGGNAPLGDSPWRVALLESDQDDQEEVAHTQSLRQSTPQGTCGQMPRQISQCDTCNEVFKRRRGGIEPLHVSMPRELKSRPSTSPTHPGQRRLFPLHAAL